MLLVGQQEQLLLTNPLYKEATENEAAGWQVIVVEGREYAPAIAELAKEHDFKNRRRIFGHHLCRL